jgi:cysteine-rich repeat protein
LDVTVDFCCPGPTGAAATPPDPLCTNLFTDQDIPAIDSVASFGPFPCVMPDIAPGIATAGVFGDGLLDDGVGPGGFSPFVIDKTTTVQLFCPTTTTTTSTTTTTTTIPPAVCSNGVVEGTETCDDGNTTGGDGCSATCAIEPGYDCTGAPSACTPICGDGLVVGNESCDDGNTTDDGNCCSAMCQIDPDGTACKDDQNACTDDVCAAGACTHPMSAPTATFLSIDCRLAALRATVMADTTGRLQQSLLHSLDRAIQRKESAEQASLAGDAARARLRLRQAIRQMILFQYRVVSLAGRLDILPPVAADLTAQATGIQDNMRTLLGTL